MIKILTAAAVIFFFLLAIALIMNLIKFNNMLAKENALKREIERLDALIVQNDGTIIYRSSAEFIENYAREYLNMIRKDEKAFRIN